ncbi:hypothetical protein [Hahella ganghwensis]|uniref:hypothetical protein n=1 Tax=Hahella ganghwensis TaxID=286420 RepID=UPI000371D201|nr:hypothetical protein [Hahella ganghwensis]
MMQDSAITDTMTEFLSQLGFENFSWQGTPLNLSFEHSGSLQIEPTNNGLLLARLHQINEFDIPDLVPKALRLVHSDQQLPFTVQTGLKGSSHLAFVTTLSPKQLTISGLTAALDLLGFLHDQLADR